MAVQEEGETLSDETTGGRENHDDLSEAGIVANIKLELKDLSATAKSFSPQAIKDGTWFRKFIESMLDSYSARIIEAGGVDFFRSKYPGLNQDQIAEKLSAIAIKYASLAGGLSGATSSAAFAATIGTGGAGVGTYSAAASALVTEMLYTTRLQVRLVYDLSVVFGYPIDTEDPEDLYRAFALAYGVAYAAGSAGAAAKIVTPEVARAHIRGLIHGHTKAIQAVAARVLGPNIGRQITQRALLRTAVPVVSMGISSGWNYISTSKIAGVARHEIRSLAKIRDAVREVSDALETTPEQTVWVLEALMAVSMCDGHFDPHEQEVYGEVVKYLDPSREQLEQLEERVEVNPEAVAEHLAQLRDATHLVDALIRCMELVAAADGKIDDREIEVLEIFFAALGKKLDRDRLHDCAADFDRSLSRAEVVGEGIDRAVARTSETVKSGLGALSGFFRKKVKPTAKTAPEPSILSKALASTPARSEVLQQDGPEPDSTSNEKAETVVLEASDEEEQMAVLMKRMKQLSELHKAGLLTDDEFSSKKEQILSSL